MQRVLKEDIGPYKGGRIYDWPRTTWEMLAKKKGKKETMYTISSPLENLQLPQDGASNKKKKEAS